MGLLVLPSLKWRQDLFLVRCEWGLNSADVQGQEAIWYRLRPSQRERLLALATMVSMALVLHIVCHLLVNRENWEKLVRYIHCLKYTSIPFLIFFNNNAIPCLLLVSLDRCPAAGCYWDFKHSNRVTGRGIDSYMKDTKRCHDMTNSDCFIFENRSSSLSGA